MATRERVAALLAPLSAEIDRLMTERDAHDPLALVQGHLQKLMRDLRDGSASVKKTDVLAQLGFLGEHSQREELTGFHEAVEQAVEEAMRPGWD